MNFVFFVRQGGDAFLNDIIKEVSSIANTKKITIRNNEDIPLIDQWMEWADICWFEWCDGLIAYGSKLKIAKERKIICRLHSYEAFTNYPVQADWQNVDILVFVAEYLQRYVTDRFKINTEKTVVIPNGVTINQWTFKQKTPGFNIAYVGYINYKKGPMLLLHTFKAIHEHDNRYKLYIAGQFQDPRYSLYFQQMIKELGLDNHCFLQGWQNNLDQWLEDKHYILCTSVLESQNMSVMQAMAKGIRPIVHNFVGAKGIYVDKYLWNTINEAVTMVTDNQYDAREYRKFIEDNYSLEKQLASTKSLIDNLIKSPKSTVTSTFDYCQYWNHRLNTKFNIEGVGYIGLGELYNQLLYQNRSDLLEKILNKAFPSLIDINVLELGPGTGIFTEYFNDNGVIKYSAIDIAKKSVCDLSKKYANFHFKQGDIADERNYDGQYDLILAADVLLHVTDEENYQKTINNISTHLKPHGICLLLDPVSIVHTKSSSPHVVIRDLDDVKKVLKSYQLELVTMLPISYFMNYPFDRSADEYKGPLALELFNLIHQLYIHPEISEIDKQLIGNYLLNWERKILYQENFGLSEKLLIVQKQGLKQTTDFNLHSLLNINSIKENIQLLTDKIHNKPIASNQLFNKINTLLYALEANNNPMDTMRNKLNSFISYDQQDFDTYDFDSAKIMIGRREKMDTHNEVIEFILNNNQGCKLVVNNIWYDHRNKTITLPGMMNASIHAKRIFTLVQDILQYKIEFKRNIAGFVFDKTMQEDIQKHSLAYLWERGIPASSYIPLRAYLKIAERYMFAAKYINKNHNILEAPCGFGYGAAYLSLICKHVEALDIADENIAFAKESYRHQNISWTIGNVTKLPYSNDEFDIYVSFEVFEHLPADQVSKYLEEAFRVLKKSGKFIISTPNIETRKHVNNPFHIKEYTFHEFKQIVETVFTNVEYYSVSNFQVDKGMQETAYTMIAVCKK